MFISVSLEHILSRPTTADPNSFLISREQSTNNGQNTQKAKQEIPTQAYPVRAAICCQSHRGFGGHTKGTPQ